MSSSDPVQTFVARWLVALDASVLALGLVLGSTGSRRGFFLAALVPITLVPFSFARCRAERVLAAGLPGRKVAVVRAYAKYLRQIGLPFSPTYVEATLAEHPAIVRGLVDLFAARFDPALGEGRQERIDAVAAEVAAASKRKRSMMAICVIPGPRRAIRMPPGNGHATARASHTYEWPWAALPAVRGRRGRARGVGCQPACFTRVSARSRSASSST